MQRQSQTQMLITHEFSPLTYVRIDIFKKANVRTCVWCLYTPSQAFSQWPKEEKYIGQGFNLIMVAKEGTRKIQNTCRILLPNNVKHLSAKMAFASGIYSMFSHPHRLISADRKNARVPSYVHWPQQLSLCSEKAYSLRAQHQHLYCCEDAQINSTLCQHVDLWEISMVPDVSCLPWPFFPLR